MKKVKYEEDEKSDYVKNEVQWSEVLCSVGDAQVEIRNRSVSLRNDIAVSN